MRNVIRCGILALSMSVAFAPMAFAQAPAPQEASVFAINPGETALAFLTRVAEADPTAVAGQVVALFKENKSNLSTLVYIALNKSGTPLAEGVIAGLSQIAADETLALELAKQISAMNVATGDTASSFVAIAKLLNSDAFSAAVGDGLADAATKAQAANNQVAVNAIQSAVSGSDVPAGVKAAFDVGFTPTAAAPQNTQAPTGTAVGAGGQAAAIGGAGAGTTNGGDTNGTQTGTQTTATNSPVDQTNGTSAPSGGSSVSTSAGQTVAQADASPTNP